MARSAEPGFLLRMPLFLLIWGIASLSMYVPAAYSLVLDIHSPSRSFFYAGTLGLICVTLIGLALGGRASRHSALSQLLSLLATFLLLPVFLAVPLHDALKEANFLNAYFDMVSSITTTGADIYDDPDRLIAPLHLWRAQVGWMGGLLMWVAASAILAPLSLGGFEVTMQSEPGRGTIGRDAARRSDPRLRLARITFTLAPIYGGLTVVIWVLLLVAGDPGLVALCHAMSIMATSGISPVGGLSGAQSGLLGEYILFLFMFFALSRLTFSTDTVARGFARLDRDPEFRIGLLIVFALPILLFLRHWVGTLEEGDTDTLQEAFRAFWGALFTVLSFLSTTGFESAEWDMAQSWSDLDSAGLILMGLALIGGGVATTAGGVKLLRVFALYLNGLHEMQRLVHPSAVIVELKKNQRIRKDGAFVAWIFFMLFALSLALITVILAATGVSFDQALVLSIASLSTTGPLIEAAAEHPIVLIELSTLAKSVLCAAMVLGRLETLAIIALFTPDLWRA
ncbi:MAG: TrkH family potassium uptake protein [Arenibacterium sp.]